MIDILKIIFLFLIAWQGPIITIKVCRGHGVIWWSFLILATGITGFIYTQFLI